MKRIGALVLAALLFMPDVALARSLRSHSKSTANETTRSRVHRTKRDPAQRHKFVHRHPCPSTGRRSGACPGYVVDHIKPLKSGGADRPSNMQWQTVAEAKAKDRWE
jgi:hypothetical protein